MEPKLYTGEKTTSSTDGSGELAIYMQKTETRLLSLTCTKIKSKWITNLNLRLETLSLLHKNIGKTLEDTNISMSFLKRTPITQEIRARTDNWDCIKPKCFCTSIETITRIKRQQTE
jgi:hypothetical protein